MLVNMQVKPFLPDLLTASLGEGPQNLNGNTDATGLEHWFSTGSGFTYLPGNKLGDISGCHSWGRGRGQGRC